MPPEATLSQWRQQGLLANLPDSWRQPLARLALAWVALFLLTAQDWFDMAWQWWDSSTYNHILFVPAIIGWLVWIRREDVLKLTPQGWWPGLVAVGGALFLWLIGSIAGVNLVSQAGAVLTMPAAVLAILGPRVSYGLLFPLAYSIFLIPFGDELVPALQMITAKIVVVLVEWSGIPAEIDGVFINTPAGLFEVAEACSGVKFLIAMIALGILICNVCFNSWKRRIGFMAVALALPIIANGVRAWGTIYIAQSQGVEFAAGFDHVFYGWVFFAIVIGLQLALWWKYFDRAPEDPAIDPEQINASPWLARLARYGLSFNAVTAGLCAMVLAFAVWHGLATRSEASVAEQVALPQVPGWQLIDYSPMVSWEPRAGGAKHRMLGRYRSNDGQEVDVFVAIYASQGEGREATAFGEGALTPETSWRWLEPGPSDQQAMGDYLLAEGRVKRLARTSFRRGELTTGSPARFKLATMADRILLRPRPTIMLILSAEQKTDNNPQQAIASFEKALGDRGEWMDRVARLR
ncbi:MAG: exosortase A [Sphingomonadaceae bacterium]|nr:exosortase A [Sphingomonadaceae bacterium]